MFLKALLIGSMIDLPHPFMYMNILRDTNENHTLKSLIKRNHKEPIMPAALLPNGLKDLLPPEAYAYRAITARVMGVFESFGYAQVKPPLAEYDSTLFADKGEHARANSFTMPDPLSGKTLAVRSDMTIQTSRIARHMMQTQSLPIRISYMGDVLRVNAESTSEARQLSQAGLELIGVQNREDEVISSIIESLSSLGLDDIVIDIHMSGLLQSILIQDALDSAMQSNIMNAIQNKDNSLIPEDVPSRDLLILLQQSGDASETLTQIMSSPHATDISMELNALMHIITKIKQSYPSISLSLDLLDTTGFEYHEGVCFSVFLNSSGLEIARGGSYAITDESGRNHAATGATLYVHRLLDVVDIKQDKQRIYIPTDADVSEARKLRENGAITVHGTFASDDVRAAEEATQLGCTKIL